MDSVDDMVVLAVGDAIELETEREIRGVTDRGMDAEPVTENEADAVHECDPADRESEEVPFEWVWDLVGKEKVFDRVGGNEYELVPLPIVRVNVGVPPDLVTVSDIVMLPLDGLALSLREKETVSLSDGVRLSDGDTVGM